MRETPDPNVEVMLLISLEYPKMVVLAPQTRREVPKFIAVVKIYAWLADSVITPFTADGKSSAESMKFVFDIS
jgi:hypothetical protein